MNLANLLPFTPYAYDGEPSICPLCGGDGGDTIVARTDRRLKKLTSVCCNGCGLVRTDPIPTEAELNAYYGGEYRQDYQFAGFRPSRRHIGVSKREAEERLKMLQSLLRPGARIMDFGSGSGEFVKAANDAGFSAVGVEPGDVFAQFARAEYRVEIVSGRQDSLAFLPESFDLITAHHVLEHLRDPIATLGRFSQWIKPTGFVYISVPDITSSGKPTFERFHFAHLYNFCEETLIAAAQKVGLTPDEHFQQRGTTLVFRRSNSSGTRDSSPTRQAVVQRVLAALPHTSVKRHVLTGAWLRPMLKRALKYRRQVKASNRMLK